MIKKSIIIEKQHSKGVVYIAFGPLYLAMALFSIRTLRRRCPELPVMLITNLDVDFNNIDYLSLELDILKIIDLDSKRNREIKTDLYNYAPFERVAYIDADTYVLGDFSNIWKFLDYFDIAFKLNPIKQKTRGKGDKLILDNSILVRDVPHFNGGVFFFKKSDKTKVFFKLWYKYFCHGDTSYDQISLVDAIFNSDARVLPLTADWNHFPDVGYYAGKVKSPFIVHYSNRISYSLEREFLKIAHVLDLDIDVIRNQIHTKRLTRQKKIGRRRWWKMLIYWKLFPQYEEKRWF